MVSHDFESAVGFSSMNLCLYVLSVAQGSGGALAKMILSTRNRRLLLSGRMLLRRALSFTVAYMWVQTQR